MIKNAGPFHQPICRFPEALCPLARLINGNCPAKIASRPHFSHEAGNSWTIFSPAASSRRTSTSPGSSAWSPPPRLRAARCCSAWPATSTRAGTCIPCPPRRRFPPKSNWRPTPPSTKFRALQPQPKRAFDANFNSDTETYEGDVAFLLELELKKDAPAGAHRTLRLRPLPDLQSQNVRAVQVDRHRHPHRGPGGRVRRGRHSRRVLRAASRPRRLNRPPRPRQPKGSSPFSPWPSASASPPSSRPASSP